MSKVFASQGDLTDKKTSFTEMVSGLRAFTDKDDPNSGVFIGDDSVMILEAQPGIEKAAHGGKPEKAGGPALATALGQAIGMEPV